MVVPLVAKKGNTSGVVVKVDPASLSRMLGGSGASPEKRFRKRWRTHCWISLTLVFCPLVRFFHPNEHVPRHCKYLGKPWRRHLGFLKPQATLRRWLGQGRGLDQAALQ